MPELLDQIRKDLSARLTELRPLVEEHQRLQEAMRVLGNVGTNAAGTPKPASASSSAPTGPSRTRRRTPPAKPRKRAPRGANRAAVLRAAQERPGGTSADLAAASGVERNTLYALLTRLVKDGELETRKLPTGRTGYALSSEVPGSQTSTE